MNIKTDLITTIVIAIIGIIIAYFVTNIFIGPIEDYSYTTIDSSISADLVDPDIEVFNYRALNPTVEVYVGNCLKYDNNGKCIEDDPDANEDDIVTEGGSTNGSQESQ